MEVGDKVKVIDQNITGVIVHVFPHEIIFRDDRAHEWDTSGVTNGELSCFPSELERISE